MPKLKNSNATFWVIFKHCGGGWIKLLKRSVKGGGEPKRPPNELTRRKMDFSA